MVTSPVAKKYPDWVSFMEEYVERKDEWAFCRRKDDCLVAGFSEATVGLYRIVIFSK